jgi:quercetin dioxygenase-like cupin family protein
MKKLLLLIATLTLPFTTGLCIPALADDYQSVRATRILTATKAANGQKLSYLKSDNPEVTAMLVEIPPGGETGWHLHSVPVYAYMLAGSISVELEGGQRYEFKEGEAIFEVRDTAHNGRNLGDKTARLVVFYTGEAGKPNVTRVKKPNGE